MTIIRVLDQKSFETLCDVSESDDDVRKLIKQIPIRSVLTKNDIPDSDIDSLARVVGYISHTMGLPEQIQRDIAVVNGLYHKIKYLSMYDKMYDDHGEKKLFG